MTAALVAVPDLILKKKIEGQPEEQFPHPLGTSAITIHKHHNYGFAMNTGDEQPKLVRRLNAALFSAFALYAAETLAEEPEKEARVLPHTLSLLSFALILGGGFSNLSDRICRGYVVDYVSFPIAKIRHVIMNIGDLGIFFGSGLMVLAELIKTLRD